MRELPSRESRKRIWPELEGLERSMPSKSCTQCGGKMLAAGALHGLQRVSFRPEGSRFFTLESGDVMTKASMCRVCGFVEIIGDVNKLRRLTSDTESGGGVID